MYKIVGDYIFYLMVILPMLFFLNIILYIVTCVLVIAKYNNYIFACKEDNKDFE